jgi:hypothetical protein
VYGPTFYPSTLDFSQAVVVEGREFVDMTIDVKDHDLDLSLTVERGASLTGRVVSEPKGALTTPIGLRVSANKAHEQLAGGMSIAAAVNADWSSK